MKYTFYNCKKLKYIDLSSFITDNERNMYGMFCFCESLPKINGSNFDTNNALNIEAMLMAVIH